MPESTPTGRHPFAQIPGVSVRVCHCGAWPESAVHTRTPVDDVEARLAAIQAERNALRVALRTARTALAHADRACRYHGEDPPDYPAWHGGCQSCQQPTRVRAALAAIAALDETDRG